MGEVAPEETTPGAPEATGLARAWRRARAAWRRGWIEDGGAGSYVLIAFTMLRLLGLIYMMDFLTLALDGPALIGSRGLTPAAVHLDRLAEYHGGRGAAFLQQPSVFWLSASDGAIAAVAWTGATLGAALLAGFGNALSLLALWALHLSALPAGQTWYGFGWELQLAETGFLAIFLRPLLDPRPHAPFRVPPPVIWLFRWLIARIMLGAGLIKLRGDPCWRDLTCLDFHFETQPVPGPLSAWFHFLPGWAHKLGVAFNHVVELAAPFLLLGPRRARLVAGVLFLALQATLISSGNLSFLNWLTLIPIVACFDDRVLGWLVPARFASARPVHRAATALAAAHTIAQPVGRLRRVAVAALVATVAALSIQPVRNLLSPQQAMNTSFNRLALVNTYGAFGSVGKERGEIVFSGTREAGPDGGPPGDGARWLEYEWRCKPGDPARRPCLMSPYHRRLDWLIWFAAMGNPARYPWAVHLTAKLLENDPLTLGLLATNPFPESPPRFVRARYFRYRFAPPGAPAWWTREPLGEWLPPLSRDDPRLDEFLRQAGFR